MSFSKELSRPKLSWVVVGKDGKPKKNKSKNRARFNQRLKKYEVNLDVMIGDYEDINMVSSNYSGTIGNATLTGSPNFQIISNTCNTSPSPCYTTIRFTPTSETVSQANFDLTWIGCPNCTPEIINEELVGVGVKFKYCPKCASKSQGSIIKNDNRTLTEEVEIQGSEFSLFYTTEFSKEFYTPYPNAYNISHFNPEAWSVSPVHYYDAFNKNLFLGTGSILKKESISTPSGDRLVVVGDNVFVFDSNGKHLSTKSALTGYVKYSFTYSNRNKLTKITDAYGKETHFYRNRAGQLVSVTSPYGQVTTVSVNTHGYIDGMTNEKNETFKIDYFEDSDLIVSFKKQNGHLSEFDYNSTNHLEYAGSPAGNFWEFFFGHDGTNPIIERFSASELFTKITNDRYASGNYVRRETSPSGFVTEYSEGADDGQVTSNIFEASSSSTTNDERFGASLRRPSVVTETINSLIKTTTYSQTATLSSPSDPYSYTQIVNTIDVNGVDTVSTFVKATNTTTTVDPMGVETVVVLDSYERPISIKLGTDTVKTIEYDANGRISQSTQNGQNTIDYTYGADGQLSSVTNALNHRTSYTYDDAGRTETVTLPDRRVISYEYNSNGQIKKITPPGKPSHNFFYNAYELIRSYLPPSLSLPNANTTYTYNTDKKIETMTRPDGTVISYDYNATTGLLEEILYGSSNAQTYTYYANSEKPQFVVSPDGLSSELTYFGLDRLASETVESGAESTKVSFTFDNFFRISNRKTYLDTALVSNVNTSYRADSQPSAVGDMTLDYDATSGRLTETTLDNIHDVRTYDSYGNIASYTATYAPTNTVLYSYTIGRDAIHRITSKNETVLGVTKVYSYQYDSAGRLTYVSKDGGVDSINVYDSNSNRISGITNGLRFTATYDNQDRLLTFDNFNFEYDDNGDLVEVSDGTTSKEFSWDELSRLKSVLVNGTDTISYKLDWRGRRVQRFHNTNQTNRLAYDSEFSLAADVNVSTAATTEYVTASGPNSADYMKVGSIKYRIIKDHLGSPRLVVKASDGSVSQRMDYNEWGNVTSDTNPGFQKFGFAGGLYDHQTKLVKFGAREYDGETGRWLSKDPIGFDGGDTNLYGYVVQDPVNFIDPNGQQRTEDPEFYDKMREQGDIAASITEALLDEKKKYEARKKYNKYQEERCLSTGKAQADQLKKYMSGN